MESTSWYDLPFSLSHRLLKNHFIQVAASNYNADASNYSPARAAEAVTVGASDITDTRESHSNFGPCVTLFAPGRNILSAGIEDDDGITRGGRTSAVCKMGFPSSARWNSILSLTLQATPFVSGIAAYWISLYNNLPPRVMKKVLSAVATKGILSDLREVLAVTWQTFTDDDLM